MADLYDITNTTNYASSSSLPEHQPDEISVFLQQIILRSSSSSSSSSSSRLPVAPIQTGNQGPVMVTGPGRIYEPGSNPSTGLCYTGNSRLSSLARALDNELDECDYESEEGGEAAVEEATVKPTPPRGSSKRTRAAEVHNLSEKRRRSRINEKMKALQNLIPNSNKTDKASMLDEAIEYLKQLQLQVQMLTMRNGLSLYPFCLPGMLQPNQIPHMRTDAPERIKSLNTNLPKAVSIDQNMPAGAVLGLLDNSVKHAPVAGFSTMVGSKTSYEIGQSIQDQFRPLQLAGSSKVICQQRNNDCPQMGSTAVKVYYPGAKSTSSVPFEPQTDSKDGTLEACLPGVHNPIFSSQLDM